MPDARPRPGPPRPAPPPGYRPPAPTRQPAGEPEPEGLRVAGPMRGVIRCVPDSHGREVLVPAKGYLPGGGRMGVGGNALVMLNRIAVYEVKDAGQPGAREVRLADGGRRALIRWACEQKLGQDAGLVAAVARRRELALRTMDRADGRRECHHVRLRAEPEWRLAVGLGNNANAHEVGLALHGTYGWPVIPGSSLKGLAAAWASSPSSGAKPDDVQRVFGTTAQIGSVRFLDAIPAGQPVIVEADVLTPHVKPYYDSIAKGGSPGNGSASPLVPPAEYHNPVPVTFLTVRGAYAVDLYGPDRADLELAAGWLKQAGDELGAGAKPPPGTAIWPWNRRGRRRRHDRAPDLGRQECHRRAPQAPREAGEH